MIHIRICITALLVACAVGQTGSEAAAAPEIAWEVENRFRFYRHAGVFKDYMKVAREAANAAGGGGWVFKTERRLQDESAHSSWAGWAAKWRDATCWDRQQFRFRVPGYADRCHDYVLPASHRVLLSVRNISAGATCAWTVAAFGADKSSHPDFVQRRAAPAPGTSCRDVPEEVPYAVSGEAGMTVSVRVTDGGAVTDLPAQKIVVTDLLVLGMGDSFGAGVGNPDLPARVQQEYGLRYQDSFIQEGGERYLPVRIGAIDGGDTSAVFSQQAEWLDVRCFRSQYGPQFRTALHLAINLRHAAVTYIDLACDGARIIEGLLHRKVLGRGFTDGTPPPESQVGLASRLLCTNPSRPDTISYVLKPAVRESQCQNLTDRQICEFARPDGRIETRYQNDKITRTSMRVCRQAGDRRFQRRVDAVLLSIGGNDIGFAPMVGHVIMDDERAVSTIGTFLGELHPGDIGRKRLALLESKYRALDRAISRDLPIRDGLKKPIFLTAYPVPIDDRGGALCGSTNESARSADAALDIDQTFARFLAKRTGRPRDQSPLARLRDVVQTTCQLNLRRFGWFDGGPAQSHIVAELTKSGAMCAGMNEAANGDPAKKLNWQYVGEHLLSYRGHGFCAHRANDALSIPKFIGVLHDDPWKPTFDSARPYRARQRWVRTPNDAFVVTNWHTGTLKLQTFFNLLSAATTSAMHPTAEGYAAMADAMLARVGTYLCTERQQELGAEPLCAAAP